MLGKYEWEVLTEMPPDEFTRWLAFLKIENAERKRSRDKAQRTRKGSGGGRVVMTK